MRKWLCMLVCCLSVYVQAQVWTLKEKVAFKEEPVSTWTRLKPLLYLAAMFVGAALIIRVASTDHKPAAVDEVAVTEVDTEVVSDEMLDVALDRAMLDDYSLYVYLSDTSVE